MPTVGNAQKTFSSMSKNKNERRRVRGSDKKEAHARFEAFSIVDKYSDDYPDLHETKTETLFRRLGQDTGMLRASFFHYNVFLFLRF